MHGKKLQLKQIHQKNNLLYKNQFEHDHIAIIIISYNKSYVRFTN